MQQYFAFQWHITDDCDQRCKHCYIFSKDTCKPLDTMNWKQIQQVLASCMDMCDTYGRLPYFYITGGDPILHPNFWELLLLLKEKRIPFTIMGNPFHLTDSVCLRLKDLGCEKYQMSLDGMRETHDWFRKPGSFDLTLDKIKCIRQAGIRSVIMSTVSGTNIKEIPDLIDTVVAHDVDIFAFARYCPTGEEKETGMKPLEYRALLHACQTKFDKHEAEGCHTYFNKKDHLWTLYEYETGRFKIHEGLEEDTIYGGCNCGNSHMTILPNGDLYACRRLESKVGNVFDEIDAGAGQAVRNGSDVADFECVRKLTENKPGTRISEIWVSEPMEAYREYSKFQKCSMCELVRFCRGCPAVAYGTTGDFYAADPQCWKEL